MTARADGAICGAKKTKGGVCQNGAGYRTSHPGVGKCVYHFGETGMHILKHERERLEALAIQYGGPIEIDPKQALLDEVYRCAGHVAWLHEKVKALGDDELTQTSIAGIQPTIWIRWYQDERARLLTAAATAAKAGVEERRILVAEEQGKILAGAIRAILGALNLSPEQERQAPIIVRNVLAALPAAA